MADDARLSRGSPRLSGDVYSFAPLARSDARVLILGSMPGKASLRAQQYYAHPRNGFWRVMDALLGIAHDRPYDQRCAALMRAGIALWDVLQSCERPSSLDADIVTASIVPNDFAGFLARHQRISHVFFNGAKAHEVFLRRLASGDEASVAPLRLQRMPSTSPAHASLSLEQKIVQWQAVATALAGTTSG